MTRHDIIITDMNREFEVKGKRQWVLTDEPDHYIICVEVTDAQAKVLGCETGRIATIVQVMEDGSAGITAVVEIGEDNQQTRELLTEYPGMYPAEISAVLGELEPGMHALAMDFLQEVGEEALEIHYAIQRQAFGQRTFH